MRSSGNWITKVSGLSNTLQVFDAFEVDRLITIPLRVPLLIYGVAQRHDRAAGLLPAPPADGSQQPFFFLLGPATPLLLDRTETADLFVEGDQVFTKLLEAVKLDHLLLRLAQRRGIGKALRDRLTGHAAREAKLRIMSRVVVFGAVAGRLPQRRTTAVMEPGRRSRKPRTLPLSVAYLICTYIYAQNNATKKDTR